MIDYSRQQTSFGVVRRSVAILDTKAAINAVCHNVATGRPGRLERAIAHRAAVLIPRHVVREVDEKLEARAIQQRLNPAAVQRAWRQDLLPHLPVVDMAIRDYMDPLLRPVLADDVDDIATAALAMLVAPSVVLSDDHDLVDHGFAGSALWVDTALDVLFIAEADEQVMSFYVGLNASINGLSAGLAGGVRFAGRQPLAAVLVIAALLVGAGLVVHRYPIVVTKLQEAGQTVLGTVEATFEFHGSVAARLPLVESPCHRVPALEQRCARVLARSAGALSVSCLQQRMINHRLASPTITEIRRTLTGHPAFVKVAPDEWQLGHRIGTPGGGAIPKIPASWRSPVPLSFGLAVTGSLKARSQNPAEQYRLGSPPHKNPIGR